jgi:hypothetical protein
VWRYGRIDELDLAAYAPTVESAPDGGGDPAELPAAASR